ncbi:MAG: signal peptidase II [Bacilli bacterium]|nr:signal peptidase II [Bacilli bacterium]
MENENKFKTFLKWFFHSYIWVGVLLLIIDIISKNIVANNMVEGDSVTVIPGFLSFTYTINRHAAFGIGPENATVSKILYICVASIACIAIPIYFAKSYKKMPGYLRAALMIILAGAVGNLIDRVFYSPEYLHALPDMPGGVVDFLDFFKGSALHNVWHFIFNIADCGVVIGVFMLFISFIIDEIKHTKEDKKLAPVEITTKVLSESEKKKLEEQEMNKVE